MNATDEIVLVRLKKAAALCDVAERTWRGMVAAGKAPQPIKVGRSNRWDRGELLAWIAERCPPVKTWQPIWEQRKKSSRRHR